MDRPIVIIGAARSGTKILRDVLAHADGTRAVPYDVNYVWRHKSNEGFSDRLDPAGLTPEVSQHIRLQLKRIARLQPGQRLIEKTVSNSLRVPFVDGVFPDAQFVHLVRDGRDVIESAMRQWRRPPTVTRLWSKMCGMTANSYGYVLWSAVNILRGLPSGRSGGSVWGPRFPAFPALRRDNASLAEICAWQWVQSVRYATDDLRQIRRAKQRVIEVRYEALMNGEQEWRRLLSFLQLSNPQAVLDAAARMVKKQETAHWGNLPADDQKAIMRIAAPVLREKGYLSRSETVGRSLVARPA